MIDSHADPRDETALLVMCPTADNAVGPYRAIFDRTARHGIPAHISLVYPFIPYSDITDETLAKLREIYLPFAPFTYQLRTATWHKRRVLHVQPVNPRPLYDLAMAPTEAFPQYRPFSDGIDPPNPSLVVGRGTSVLMRAAHSELSTKLPISGMVTHVELWAGPALRGAARRSWGLVEGFPLGG